MNFSLLLIIMKKIKQIGIMWSAADLWYMEEVKNLAFSLGKELAENWYILVYGAEKDTDSLSAIAARWAKDVWWIVMWVTYGKQTDIRWDMRKYTDCLVCTGMERWWWREYVLVSSCDAIITIWWWSWTLNEMTIAYQKKIPIVCMEWTWWRSDRLKGQYIDERYKTDNSRYICKWAATSKEALDYLKDLE